MPNQDQQEKPPRGFLTEMRPHPDIRRAKEGRALLVAENTALLKCLRWAMQRIEKHCPHRASEGDAELYRFAEAKNLTGTKLPDAGTITARTAHDKETSHD